ncbi:MAG: glycosyltransferase family 9 protein [Ignavibacteriae bacterium]|nr:glycosyltransferase family 9 protein [Ignavibacteriota bacterium]
MKNIQTYFANLFLQLAIKLLKKSKSSHKISINRDSKILIIVLRNKSESLLITPLLQLIYEKTNSQISVLTNEENEIIFLNNPFVKNIYRIDDNLSSQFSQILKFNKNNFDVIVNPNEIYSQTEILYSAFIKSKFKIGFKNISDNIFSHILEKHNPVTNHFVDRIISLCEVFEFDIDKSHLNLFYQPSQLSLDEVERFLLTIFNSNKLLVIINISDETNNNFWGVDSFKKLIRYLKNYDVNIIITTLQKDVEFADKISDGKEKIFFIDEFDKFAALISYSNFIFTLDNFALQLATVFKKPVFCLFGKQNNNELIRVPYISDFDFIRSDESDLSDLHYGKVLNSFIPYFDYVFENFQINKF